MNEMRLTQIPFPGSSAQTPTGAMQFQDDWPGFFLRGDDAILLKARIQTLIKRLGNHEDPAVWSTLDHLEELADLIERDVVPEVELETAREKKCETSDAIAVSGTGTSFALSDSFTRKNDGTERDGKSMLIRLGYELVFQVPARTPMLLMLYIHPSRAASLREADRVHVEPDLPVEEFTDPFGNHCGRLVAPPGKLRLWNTTLIEDSGEPDRFAPSARSSRSRNCRRRCCRSCSAAGTARSTNSPTSPGRSLAKRRLAGRGFRPSATGSTGTSSSATIRQPVQERRRRLPASGRAFAAT